MAYNQLDICILVFFVIMAIFGYKKGFITRLYDVLSLLLVLYLSYILSNPLSYYINVSSVIGNDPIALLVSQFTNQIIMFFILFIALFIIKKIIGLLIKPILNKLIKIFKITDFINHILGLVLSVCEAFILSYIALILLLTPIYQPGSHLVNNSQIAQTIFQFMPTVSHSIIEFSSGLSTLSKEHSSSDDVMTIMLIAYNYNLINDEQVDILVNNYLNTDIQSIDLNENQYDLLKQLLDSSSSDDEIKEKILNKVNVSGE